MANRFKGQATIYRALHGKLKMKQQELHSKPEVNSCATSGLAVVGPHVTQFDTKGAIRIRKSKDCQHNGEKKKNKINYLQSKRSSNTNPTKNRR